VRSRDGGVSQKFVQIPKRPSLSSFALQCHDL
jgi:hypothetical protein